jgi:hypothetical protein
MAKSELVVKEFWASSKVAHAQYSVFTIYHCCKVRRNVHLLEHLSWKYVSDVEVNLRIVDGGGKWSALPPGMDPTVSVECNTETVWTRQWRREKSQPVSLRNIETLGVQSLASYFTDWAIRTETFNRFSKQIDRLLPFCYSAHFLSRPSRV